MLVKQTKLFARQKKKLHANPIVDLDHAINAILKNPTIGELKKGDLQSTRVYKFKMQSQLTLLAYQVTSLQIELLSLGTHENFYRDLKKLIRH